MSMSFKQIYTQVSQHVQDTGSGRQTRIKDSINRKYQELADGFDWPDLYRIELAEVTVTAGESTIMMPAHVDIVKKIILDSNKDLLLASTPSMFFKRNFDILDNSSNPFQFTIIGTSPFKRPITTAETLVFVSSDAADTTPIVQVWGLVNGEEINESITMNGTTNVTSSNTFSRVTRIGTDTSVEDSSRAGNITVTGTTSSTEYAVIKAHEFDSRYQVLRLQDGASAGTTLSVFYKKKVQRLINDGDSLEIPVGLILFELAVMDILDSQGKSAQAREHERKAERLKLEMLSRHFMQTEAVFQSSPLGPGTGTDISRFGHFGRRISVQG